MDWSEAYNADSNPTMTEIGRYIDNPFWNEFCSFIEDTYSVAPLVEYSKCSMARGFNVKYRKGSRSICTLYPNKGYFTCMVVIGSKEAPEAEFLLPACDPYIMELYKATSVYNGSRWLMIDVTSKAILDSAKELVKIRCKPKK
ncbi:MAG: DUF3788 domain-containing protein [Angelakisella sp.]